MKYRGGCHCGKVTIEVEGEITGAVSCNCSICTKRGSLLWFVPRDQMTLTGESELTTYTFNKHVIKHRFCKHCGVLPFGEGTDPKGDGDSGDQHPLPGRFRVRQSAGAPLQRQGALTPLGSTPIYMRRAGRLPRRGSGSLRGARPQKHDRARHARGVRNRRALPDVSRVRVVRGGMGSCAMAGRTFALAGWLFVAGIVIFSGSLYLMAFTGSRWLGAVTPLGGLAFLAGWLCLAWGAATKMRT